MEAWRSRGLHAHEVAEQWCKVLFAQLEQAWCHNEQGKQQIFARASIRNASSGTVLAIWDWNIHNVFFYGEKGKGVLTDLRKGKRKNSVAAVIKMPINIGVQKLITTRAISLFS